MAKIKKERLEIWVNHSRCDAGWILFHLTPNTDNPREHIYTQIDGGVVLRKHKERYTQSVIEATTEALKAIPEDLRSKRLLVMSPIVGVIGNERDEDDWGYAEYAEMKRIISNLGLKPEFCYTDKDSEQMVDFKKAIRIKAEMMREDNADFMPDYVAFTDGSCNNLSPYGEGGAAYVVVEAGDRIVAQNSKGFIGTSNNRMELLAIISAVNWLPDGASMLVKTDSKYCIMMLDHEDCPYKINKNEDLVRKYYRIKETKGRIEFEWVKGHSGVEFNEMADSLADSRREEMRLAHNIPEYNKYNSPKCRKC